MVTRYTDINAAAEEAKDFAVRQRKPFLHYLVFFFAITCLIAIGLTLTVGNKIALSILLFALLGTVGWYVIYQLQHNRDLVLATEFQNALFASALGLNHKFCMIIKRDGNIIYLDRSFQDMFPDFVAKSRRSLGALLQHAKISPQDSKKVSDAIDRGTYDKAILNVRDSHGIFHHIVMSIEPITRPSGFILLRGREYVERRSSDANADSVKTLAVNKPTITLFSHIMDSMKIGVYMASPNGQLIYVNPLLEQWLGYQEDEMASGNLMLQDIIYQRGTPNDTIVPTDYEGEIALQKKSGRAIKAFVNQKTIRDDQGKLIGCTAMVHQMNEPADIKKTADETGF